MMGLLFSTIDKMPGLDDALSKLSQAEMVCLQALFEAGYKDFGSTWDRIGYKILPQVKDKVAFCKTASFWPGYVR